MKELAKKHNGWYSRYAKKYLFNTTEDRDGFVADVNREFFSKNDNAVDNQQADEVANKAVEQAEQEAKSKDAEKKQADSDENDYHGFLDDKKPGEIAEIKRVLQAKTDPFGGDNGYVTSKHIMETLARSNAKGEVKNNRYYINGERTKKAAYAYFEYLRKIGYKGNETAGAEQEHISNDNTDNSQPELTEDKAREEIEKTANDFLDGKNQGEEAIAQLKKIRKYFAGDDNPNKSFEMVRLCNNKISMVEEITAPFADEKYQAGNLRFADEYRRYHKLESAPQENDDKGKTTTENSTVVVTGKEFGEYSSIKELRNLAKSYYKNNLQGTSVNNPILGEVNLADTDVDFTGKGISKAISTSAKENKLLLIKYLPELIRKANKVSAKNNEKTKRNAYQYTYLESSAVVDGVEQPVEITIFTDVNGNRYYNHILPLEELEAQKNRSLPVYPAQAPNDRNGIPAVSQQTPVNSSVSQNKAPGNVESSKKKGLGAVVYSTPHENKHDGNYTDGSYTDKGGSMRGRVKDGIIEVW